MRKLIATAVLCFSSVVSAQDYRGGLPEADAILNSSRQIERTLAAKLHAESVRLQGIADALNENCSAQGTGDDNRDLRCGMILGAWMQSREDLMQDVRDARDGNYQPPRRVEDVRCAPWYDPSGPRYFENMGVKCDGPYRAE